MRSIIACTLSLILLAVGACNSDSDLSVKAPKITLSQPDGVYTVKVGKTLVIEPEIENLTPDASVQWTESGAVISTSPVLRSMWSEPGEHFITLTVTNAGGSASAQLRVEVVEKEIPYISLPFSGNLITVLTGTTYVLTPEVAATDSEDFSIEWKVDGKAAGSELTFRYEAAVAGNYSVKVTAKNVDGSDSRTFTLRVADTLPASVRFPSQSYLNASTKRFTFPGRQVQLMPLLEGLEGKEFAWAVDGEAVDCKTRVFAYTPSKPGTAVVSVTVDGRASASVEVECVNATEQSRRRAVSGGCGASFNEVYEWIPAPGQFIGCTTAGGMTGNEKTHAQALEWAKKRMDESNYVSLGAFGGYIIVGFDHSVPAVEGKDDFSIGGNAFANTGGSNDGSNEPGIVYVSQDVNGNGLPDDEWYELKGSDTFLGTTRRDYAVTYYRPSGAGMNVLWTDNYGGSGTVDYLKSLHRQEYYYPAWVTADSYTLYGTCMAGRTSQNAQNGYWNNNSFGWGYADNVGSDNIAKGDAGSGLGQRTGFRIENAVQADGSAIKLQYVDFVKVQTGVQCKAGGLGEVSTEVVSFHDLSM